MVTIAVLLSLTAVTEGRDYSDLQGPYCASRAGRCCPDRRDDCSVPILGTRCYCDHFCNRTHNEDCCPDYWKVCLGIDPPTPIESKYLSCAVDLLILVAVGSINVSVSRCNVGNIGYLYSFVCLFVWFVVYVLLCCPVMFWGPVIGVNTYLASFCISDKGTYDWHLFFFMFCWPCIWV